MILIINTCNEEMHYYEFVKPIEDILKNINIRFNTISSRDISERDILDSRKIIITGTSLKDFNYKKKDYSWIKRYPNPLLGICAGAQIICKEFGCALGKGMEIGLHEVRFNEKFLSISKNETIQAYCLHNSIIKNSKESRLEFDIYGKNKYMQAIKHKDKPIYATLFHPEVRNKNIIKEFLNIK